MSVGAEARMENYRLIKTALLDCVWWAMTVFYVDNGTVSRRDNAWWLAVVALTFLVTQGLLIIYSSEPWLMLFGLMTVTGIAAGNTLGQLIQYRRVWVTVESQQHSGFEGAPG